VIVVDTSAIIAIWQEEPEWELLLDRLYREPDDERSMSVACFIEAGTVMAGRRLAGPADALDESPAARLERSRLRIERASQNSQKNAEETAGIAVSFDGIREELVNNRVDTEELRVRLKDQIADPLHSMVRRMYPELETRLKALSAKLAAEKSVRDPAHKAAQINISRG